MVSQAAKISLACFTAGSLLLLVAGILAFTSGSPNAQPIGNLRGRLLIAGETGLSGTPSGEASDSGSGSLDHSAFGGNHVYTLAPFGVAGGDLIIYVVFGFFCAIYAWFYKQMVVEHIEPLPPQPDTGRDDFDPGICECWLDTNMCCHLLVPCMAYARQAHTNEVTGIASFWCTFYTYLISGLCCGIGPCCLTVFFRMRLKEHMGVEDHLVNDLCCAWACAPCAIGQAAMAVDRKLGYEVEMCCNLRWTVATENVYKDGTISGYDERPEQSGYNQRYDYQDPYQPGY